MAKATGAQTSIAYVVESVWGTTPASPAMKELRCKSESIDLAKAPVKSGEIKPHRMPQNLIHGMHNVAGDVVCEFGNFLDDWLEAALFGQMASNIIKLGQYHKSFTVERRLHTIHEAFQYSGVRPNGLKLSLKPDPAIAEIIFPVIGKTLITDNDALGSPQDWLVNSITPPVIGGTAVVVDTGTVNPAPDDTFIIYMASDPTKVRSEQIFKVVSYTPGTFTIVFSPSLDVNMADNDILHFIRPATVISSADPMNSFGGALTEGGSVIAIATQVDLEVGQSIDPAKTIGSNQPQELIESEAIVKGTLRVYVENIALFNKFLNENYSTLQVAITGGGVTYTWLLPRIKYTGAKINKPADGKSIIQELPFEALYDTTEGTALKITKA